MSSWLSQPIKLHIKSLGSAQAYPLSGPATLWHGHWLTLPSARRLRTGKTHFPGEHRLICRQSTRVPAPVDWLVFWGAGRSLTSFVKQPRRSKTHRCRRLDFQTRSRRQYFDEARVTPKTNTWKCTITKKGLEMSLYKKWLLKSVIEETIRLRLEHKSWQNAKRMTERY